MNTHLTQRNIRYFWAIFIVTLFIAIPIAAQTPLPTTEPMVTEVVTEAVVQPVVESDAPTTPIVIQQPSDGGNTRIIFGVLLTVAVIYGIGAFKDMQQGKTLIEIVKLRTPQAVESVITSEDLSKSVEAGLTHIPESLRNVLVSIVDVFDPLTASTTGDLDNRTQEWVKNMLDGNPETGAVTLTPDLEMNAPDPSPVG